ncbi:hypothetical protein MXB_810 [Myxobolus squamalis]|nr:hypothetical protein MXB_810 [Myxobolus squamalis]
MAQLTAENYLTKVIYMGPARAFFKFCQVKTESESLHQDLSIKNASFYYRSFHGLFVRATGYYYLQSRQPKGFQKIVRMSEDQIGCCLRKNWPTAIC